MLGLFNSCEMIVLSVAESRLGFNGSWCDRIFPPRIMLHLRTGGLLTCCNKSCYVRAVLLMQLSCQIIVDCESCYILSIDGLTCYGLPV